MAKNIIQIIVDANSKAMNKTFGQVDKSLDKTKKKFKVFGDRTKKVLAGVGASVTALSGVMAVGVKKAIDYGLEIDNLRKSTGLTAEQTSRLSYAMEQEHGSTEDLARSIPVLARRINEANYGMETYTRAFREAGVEIKDSEGNIKNTSDVLLEISDYMQSGASDTNKMAVAQQLLGRSGKNLVPFLKLGRDAIEELGDEAEQMGIVLSDKTTADMKRFDDQLTAVKGGIKGVFVSMTQELLPSLEGVATLTKENLPEMRKDFSIWFKQMVEGSIMLVEKFGPAVTFVWETFKTGVSNLVQQAIYLKNNFGTILDAIGSIIEDKVWDILATIQSITKTIVNNITWTGKQIYEEIVYYFNLVFEHVETTFKNLINLGHWLGENFVNAIKNMFDVAVKSFSNFKDYISDWSKFIMQRIRHPFDEDLEPPNWEGLTKGFEATWSKLEIDTADSTEDIRKKAEALFSDELPKTFQETYTSLRDKLPEAGAEGADTLKNILLDLPGDTLPSYQEIKENFSGLMDRVQLKSKETSRKNKEDARDETTTRKALYKNFADFASQKMGQWSGIATSAVNAFTNNFSQAMTDVILGAKSAKDAMSSAWKNIKKTVIKTITDMIAKWLVFKTMTAGFGLDIGGGFGGFLGLKKGGPIPEFQSGGEVPIIAHSGEYVIPRNMVNSIKRTGAVPSALVQGIQRGTSPRGGSYQSGGMVRNSGAVNLTQNIPINVGTRSEEDVGVLIDRIGQEIENRTNKGIKLAQKAYNSGKKNSGDAV